MLGHSMGILVHLYELPGKAQKLLGESGGIPPLENLGILQPPRSVLRSYRSEAQVVYGRIAYPSIKFSPSILIYLP